MRAKEFLLEQKKTTLNKIYSGEFPDRNELFWEFVSSSDLDKPIEVQTMPKHKLMFQILGQYGVEHIEEIEDMLKDEQREIVDHYIKDPSLSNQIIVIADHKIIDGNHRALAAAIKGVPINYVELDSLDDADEEEELDEDWKKSLATAAMAGSLALGGHALMKNQPPPSSAADTDPAPITQQAAAQPEVTLPVSKPAVPSVVRQIQAGLKTSLGKALASEAGIAGIKGEELAQFLAQCAHETSNFTSLKEFGGKLDFKKYDIRHNPRLAKILGNTKPGDGLKYIGRGFIQLTGKDNYKRVEKALGIPIVANPNLVENPEVAAKIAVWYWQNRVAPKVDDFSNTTAATKPINSNLNGLDDRHEKFKAMSQLLGVE
jgi:putative chitinase